jgi:uncharacterized protein YcnI
VRPRALAVAVLGLALLAPAAAAHVQIEPAQVAPGDAATFTILVPNERDTPTMKVAVKIPNGLIPFAFEENHGWVRSEERAANGALDSVTWTGSLPAGSFVRFSFLASTPDAEGTLTFPTVQTYADGQEVAWIGPPDADEPAPTIEVTKAAATANAGGEGGAPATTAETAASTGAPVETTAPLAATAAPSVTTVASPVPVGDASTPTAAWVALALAGAALLAALAALGIALARRPRTRDGGDPEAF